VKRPKVVILGAGFGGLTAARALRGFCDVVLIDRNNYQTFLPLLYQVSTAGLAADHIAYPIRGAVRKSKIKFLMGSPVSIDYKKKTLKIDSGDTCDFDYLVVALGSVTNDFGIPGVKENALGMKSLQEALHIRSTIMKNFENLCRSADQKEFVVNIVGGGPTGVEMAGAIAELRNGPLRSDFAEAANRIKINIIEAGSRLLPSFSPSLSRKTAASLKKLGVEVLEDKSVAEIKSHSIIFKDKSVRKSDITVWTAGVKGETTPKKLHLPYERGRLKTEQTLQVVDHPDVFAIGDISGARDENGNFLPMVAPVAMQQGRFLAEQIKNLSEGKAPSDFVYRDKGSMATIGRHKAVVQVGKIGFSGIPAWYAWLWLHLFYLLGGRNKLGTMADWIWNYLTFDRSNRHIIDLETN
jgi:NADH:ubiquinone reductase (H+-translocating)